jgi:hypothetical protein
MKKILAIVCLLVLAAACATQPSGNKDTANANNVNKPAETMSTAPPSESDIIAKEKAAWEAFKAKNETDFKKSLAPEYFGVSATGVSDIAGSVAAMKDSDLTDFTLSDWKMTTIDKDAVLLTYTAMEKGTYKGKAVPPGPYYEASAYVNRNGEWVNVYYQETLKQEMPMPSTSPSPAKASSPMSKPSDTTDDPVANEKLVWEALKSRNYDAFGSYLADNATEIEADGVFDKAGSIKGVQGFDASKSELSDWKSLKFDEDAAIVTYKVKIPGEKPDTGYHSTIWVKRDGQWRAFFHMGTSAQDLTMLPASEKSMSPEKKMSPAKKM